MVMKSFIDLTINAIKHRIETWRVISYKKRYHPIYFLRVSKPRVGKPKSHRWVAGG